MIDSLSWNPKKKQEGKKKVPKNQDCIEVQARDKMSLWVIECSLSALIFQYEKIFGNDKLLEKLKNV